MTTTVSASAASAAWTPSQYMQVRTAAPPAATGITGMSDAALGEGPG